MQERPTGQYYTGLGTVDFCDPGLISHEEFNNSVQDCSCEHFYPEYENISQFTERELFEQPGPSETN